VKEEKVEEKVDEEVKEDGDKERKGEEETGEVSDADSGEGEEDEKDKVIRELREELARAGNKDIVADKDIVQEQKQDEPVKVPDFIGEFVDSDEEYDKAFEKREAFNEVLKKVHTRAVETTLKLIPQVIDNVVKSQVVMYTKATEFFGRNRDLKEYSGYIAKVANEIASKDPSLSLDDIFGTEGDPGKLAVEVRKALKLKGNVIKKEAEKVKERPAFIKQGGGVRIKPEVVPIKSGIEAEIGDLIENI
jgi:hypothetical protein